MKPLNALLELLYPPKCVFCRRILDNSRELICPDCAVKLPRTVKGGERHGDFYSVCYSPLFYTGVVRDSILRYKFGGSSSYAPVYGKLIAACLTEYCSHEFDIISWAPLSKRRLRRRGYDQAALIAGRCSELLGKPCVKLLDKKRNNAPQSGIGTEEKRRANVSGVYRARDPSLIRNNRILLIDDVCTTGATFSECARVLLMSGANEVCCASLATKHSK